MSAISPQRTQVFPLFPCLGPRGPYKGVPAPSYLLVFFCPEKSLLCTHEHFDLLHTVLLARCLSYISPLWILKCCLLLIHSSKYICVSSLTPDRTVRRRDTEPSQCLALYCLLSQSFHWDVRTFSSNKFYSLFTIVCKQCCYGNKLCQGINMYRKLTKKHRRLENGPFYLWDWIEMTLTTMLISALSFLYTEVYLIYYYLWWHFNWLPHCQQLLAPAWPSSWCEGFGAGPSIPKVGEKQEYWNSYFPHEWDIGSVCWLQSLGSPTPPQRLLLLCHGPWRQIRLVWILVQVSLAFVSCPCIFYCGFLTPSWGWCM